MQKRSIEITEILRKEREKAKKDTENIQNRKEIPQIGTKRQYNKEKKIETQNNIREKWEICKWITAYLEENIEEWEKDDEKMYKETEEKKTKVEENEKTTQETTNKGAIPKVWKKNQITEDNNLHKKENNKTEKEKTTSIKTTTKNTTEKQQNQEVNNKENPKNDRKQQQKLTNYSFTTETKKKDEKETRENKENKQTNNMPKIDKLQHNTPTKTTTKKIKTTTPKPSPKITKTTAKTKNKKKLEEERKSVKQLKGFWTKFAQKQKEREREQETKIPVKNSDIQPGLDSEAENRSGKVSNDKVGQEQSNILVVNHVGQKNNLPFEKGKSKAINFPPQETINSSLEMFINILPTC